MLRKQVVSGRTGVGVLDVAQVWHVMRQYIDMFIVHVMVRRREKLCISVDNDG